MNWVGGARNRLKVPNERKIQIEYFERKRLASKLNRGQERDLLKAPISKDLLFLSKAASNAKIDEPHPSPTRQVPKRVNLDSCAKHPMRDIALPMSPIEKPSTLDLVDTNTVASNLSFDQSFYRNPVDTVNLPKVSTMKMPSKQDSNCRESGADMLDVSCMTEALFPLAKSTVKKEPHNVDLFAKDSNRQLSSKKYSLDNLLDASQVKESFFHKLQQKAKEEAPPKTILKHADQMLWSKVDGVFGNRKRPSAYGVDNAGREAKQQKLAKKEKTRYNFRDWMAQTKKSKDCKPKANIKDATLEIQYAPVPKKETMPVLDLLYNHAPETLQPPKDESKKHSRSAKESKQWTSTSSLLLTENPLATYHLPSAKTEAKTERPPTENIPSVQSESHNVSSLHDESILGPIIRMKNKQSNNKLKRSTTFEQMMSSFEADCSDKKGVDVEDVIVGLDGPKPMVRSDHEQVGDWIEEEKLVKHHSKQHSLWKDFVSGDNMVKPTLKEATKPKEVTRPKTHCSVALSKLPLLKTKRTMNCSVFEEVIGLEQEVLVGLDVCTQELTLSPIDCTEEPIMQRVPDITAKITKPVCPFDSSQDSYLTAKSQSQSEDKPQSQHYCQDQGPQPFICLQNQTQESIDTDMRMNDYSVVGKTGFTEDYTPNDSEIEKPVVSCEIPVHHTVEVCDSTPSAKQDDRTKKGLTNEELLPLFFPSRDDVSVTGARCSKQVQWSPQYIDQMAEPETELVDVSTQMSPCICKDKEQQTFPTTKSTDDQTPNTATTAPLTGTEGSGRANTPELTVQTSTQEDATNHAPFMLDASTQTGTSTCKQITALQEEVKLLREELKAAESTMIWQSLMMRLHNIQHL